MPPGPFVAKTAAAVATLGLGGACGFEGPSIYLGSSIGAFMRRRFPRLFTEGDHRVLLTAGAPKGWQLDDQLALAEWQGTHGQADAALASLNAAAAMDSTSSSVPFQQGLLELRAGRTAEAAERFTRASALDPTATTRIEELILDLKGRYTIVVVTHNMQQAARISDYTAFMLQGVLVEHDGTRKVFTSPREKLTEDYITGRFG